ncbi:hypothetical protein EOM86_10990 [Candidatus Nomurabacteria bacterium]|nr:hypothetical protein [Candidatus Nomurabacteria bacterium]
MILPDYINPCNYLVKAIATHLSQGFPIEKFRTPRDLQHLRYDVYDDRIEKVFVIRSGNEVCKVPYWKLMKDVNTTASAVDYSRFNEPIGDYSDVVIRNPYGEDLYPPKNSKKSETKKVRNTLCSETLWK